MAAETVVSAFGAEHVARITGLTPHQLTYWDRIGFFQPSLARSHGGERPMRVYSFKDVVGLRVISVLLKEHGISLRHLKQVARKLLSYSDTPWSSLKLMVCKGEASFIEPATGQGLGVLSGQYVLVPVVDQIEHVRQAAADLSRRSDAQIGLVERHRNVAHNARVFAGTRVPVRAVERFLAAGYSPQEILAEYPSLHIADIEAIQREMGQQEAA
jgi:DNA-binding transcriptional MerR regulator